MPKRFSVLYYSGGTERGHWRRVFDEYDDEHQAKRIAHGIERMGYKTLIEDRDQLELIGKPEDWNAMAEARQELFGRTT